VNILQILPALDVGGVETGTIDVARYLVSKGHKAVCVSAGGRLVRELDKINARHYNLPVGRKNPITILMMIRQLKGIIRREDIDVVHARSRVPAIIAYFACKSTDKVFITTAHGYYKKHILSSAMSWGKFVIVASNIMAKHMMHNFGVPYERIRLIPRGVELSRFRFKSPDARRSKGFTIGMVSRITPLKGHADFIKAVSILNRQIPNLRALIVGSAQKEKYKEDLELLVRRLGLSRTIEFQPSTQDVPGVMANLDVLVSATVTPEAFGRVIIEAQASGVPVVSTKVGGVVDIVEDEKNGLLCPAQNPKEMASRILRLYNDRELGARLASEGKKSVEKDFDLDTMARKTIAVYEEALRVQNILVIKISAVGDVILSVPSLKAIRSRFPNAVIKVLVGVQSREVLDRCPYINDLIVCDLKVRHKGISGILRLGQELRKSSFDIVIDLQNNRSSHILAGLSLASSRYGYDNGKWSFLLNRSIKDDAPYLDPIEHQFRTLKLAGIKPQDRTLELWPSEADEKNIGKFLEDNWVKPDQGLMGINVRASSRWGTKNWPPSFIAELCDRLAKRANTRVVLTGAKSDVEIAMNIARLARSKPIIAAGKTTINELASLMKRFKVYLTPDSAPMHIATSANIPFIALFGPTDPSRHVVKSRDCVVICKSTELKCSPCYSPSCSKKNSCMRRISVDEVFKTMERFL
jgi:lipopolysaccharide heptosyltransferase II